MKVHFPKTAALLERMGVPVAKMLAGNTVDLANLDKNHQGDPRLVLEDRKQGKK